MHSSHLLDNNDQIETKSILCKRDHTASVYLMLQSVYDNVQDGMLTREPACLSDIIYSASAS